MRTSRKVRENRLRRMALRQGLVLKKSRIRDPRALDYGKWLIVPDERQGQRGVGIELRGMDEVEVFLTAERSRRDADVWRRIALKMNPGETLQETAERGALDEKDISDLRSIVEEMENE